MTVQPGAGPQGQNDNGTGPGNSGDPSSLPYANELNSLPESVRPLVEPVFKQWDQKTNQRFEDLQGQISRYQPWDTITQQYQPQDVQMAIEFAQQLNNDPEAFYQRISQALGYEIVGDEEEEPDYSNFNENQYPGADKLQSLEQGFSQFLDQYQQDQDSRQQEAEEAEIYSYLQEVSQANSEKYGPLDNRAFKMILSAASADPSDDALDNALNWYYTEVAQPVNGVQTPPANMIPSVPGAGGSLPTNGVDTSKMSKRDTENFVANLLNQVNQQG